MGHFALAVACFAEPVSADGFVMVIENGVLSTKPATRNFARHYDSSGQDVGVRQVTSEVDDASDGADEHTDEQSAPSHVPSHVASAISDVGLTYVGHRGLRRAGLSVSDWLALFQANIQIESAYRQSALSSVGAIGLGQLMPDTAKSLGVDPYDMKENLDGSARYLLMMLEEFGEVDLALAGYNAGPSAVIEYGGIPPFKETQGHVEKVLEVFNKLRGDAL